MAEAEFSLKANNINRKQVRKQGGHFIKYMKCAYKTGENKENTRYVNNFKSK